MTITVGHGAGGLKARRCASIRRGFARSAVLALCAATGFAETAPDAVPDSGVQASALVAQARHEREAGRFVEARKLCEQAIALVPGDAEARRELARIESTAAGRDTGSTPALVKPDLELRNQLAVADARVIADRAELLAADGRHAEAGAELAPAIAALSQVDVQVSPEARNELARLRSLADTYQQAAEADR